MSPAEVELYPTYFCSRWSKISGSGTASQMPMARIDERIIWLVLDCQDEGKNASFTSLDLGPACFERTIINIFNNDI